MRGSLGFGELYWPDDCSLLILNFFWFWWEFTDGDAERENERDITKVI